MANQLQYIKPVTHNIYFEITSINRYSLVTPQFKQLSSQMKCKKRGGRVLQTPWNVCFQLTFRTGPHLYSCVKSKEMKPEIPKYFQTGLDISTVHYFSLPGEWINEWFALWGENPFTRENILNSYHCRRKTRVDLHWGVGWGGKFV